MKSKPRIAFVGDITIDTYLKQNETHLGGSSLTGAIWANRLGAKVSIVAAVGDDGVQLPKLIDTRHVSILPGKTSAIEIHTTKAGEREYGAWDAGVLEKYLFSKKDVAFMQKHNAIVLIVYNKTEQLLRQFYKTFSSRREKRFLRVIDFGDLSQFKKDSAFVGGVLSAIDIAVFGLDKHADRELINELRILSKKTNTLFLITLNRYGAVAFSGSKMWGIPGKDVKVVDTTGAGDAFLAAFLVSYLQARDIQKSLEEGTKLASKVIQKIGAY